MAPSEPLARCHEAMGLALAEAASCGPDVPVGAVVLGRDGQLLAAAGNRRERDGDPTAHAELLALRAAAAQLGGWRLAGASLVVTLEPCPMCAGASVLARVEHLAYGAADPKAGACGSVWDLVRDRRANWRPQVHAGLRAAECSALLADFFASRRGRQEDQQQ